MKRILYVKDDMGEEKEIRIELPEGYIIDKENSTLECIKLKQINKPRFSDYDGKCRIEEGWGIKNGCVLHCIPRKKRQVCERRVCDGKTCEICIGDGPNFPNYGK